MDHQMLRETDNYKKGCTGQPYGFNVKILIMV